MITDAGTEMPVVSMLDDVLAPAMHNIGALWRDEEIMVADEHLASTICHRLLAEISPALQVEPAGTRETVLLITPSSEQHTFGLSMAQNVLYGAGYKTVLVGGEAPGRALNAALLGTGPRSLRSLRPWAGPTKSCRASLRDPATRSPRPS